MIVRTVAAAALVAVAAYHAVHLVRSGLVESRWGAAVDVTHALMAVAMATMALAPAGPAHRIAHGPVAVWAFAGGALLFGVLGAYGRPIPPGTWERTPVHLTVACAAMAVMAGWPDHGASGHHAGMGAPAPAPALVAVAALLAVYFGGHAARTAVAAFVAGRSGEAEVGAAESCCGALMSGVMAAMLAGALV